MVKEVNVINEDSIFGPVVFNSKHENLEEIATNTRVLFNMISRNIFDGYYYVMYEALAEVKKYGEVLTFDLLNQILLGSIGNLYENKKVMSVFDKILEGEDEAERKEEIIDLVLTKFEELSEESNFENYKATVASYLQTWSNEQFILILKKAHKITTHGDYVGKKFLQGSEDAKNYVDNESSKILYVAEAGLLGQANVDIQDGTEEKIWQDIEEELLEDIVTKTNIAFVDDALEGFRKKEILVVFGVSGGGKSRFCVSLAHQAMLEGKNGIYIALEGNKHRLYTQFLARHIQMLFNKKIDNSSLFLRNYDESMKNSVMAAQKHMHNNPGYGKLSIVPGPLKDENVMSLIEEHHNTKFEVDYVVLDYLTLLESDKYDTNKAKLASLIPKLETFAQSFNGGKGLLFIFPHQLNTETIKALMKGQDSTIVGAADAIEVIRCAHNAITLYSDDECKLKKQVRIYCTKSRNSQYFPDDYAHASLGNCVFAGIEK